MALKIVYLLENKILFFPFIFNMGNKPPFLGFNYWPRAGSCYEAGARVAHVVGGVQGRLWWWGRGKMAGEEQKRGAWGKWYSGRGAAAALAVTHSHYLLGLGSYLLPLLDRQSHFRVSGWGEITGKCVGGQMVGEAGMGAGSRGSK